jgi:hypothetical protein
MPLNKCFNRGCITPICLAASTKIATPNGEVLVTELTEGMLVWTVDGNGERIASPIISVSRTHAPANHQVVELSLSDGRQVLVSPSHPTNDGRTIGELRAGDRYDGSTVQSATLIPYSGDFTYDLLPDSETGFYWADGILMGSTLR